MKPFRKLPSPPWRWLIFLIPSFITNTTATSPAQSRRHTLHLDGLRGLAALCVYNMHLSMTLDRTTLLGYLPGVSESFVYLPVVRLFRCGKAMVRIFFALSGYALSVSPSRHLDAPDGAGKLHRALGVAALKRPLRLFLPPLATTSVVLLLVLVDLFPTPEQLEALPAHLPPQTVVRRASPWLQIADWLGFITGKLANPWRWVEDLYVDDRDSYYGTHLWTIQTEFRCSAILFAVLGAASVLERPAARLLLLCALVVFCAGWARWDVALFLAGSGLCLTGRTRQGNLDILPVSGQEVRKSTTGRTVLLKSARWVATMALFLAGLWMLSYPDDKAERAWGFRTMSMLWASADVWQSAGAVAVVWSAGELQTVKAVLSSRFAQYLGSVSFSLYLVHYPLLEVGGWQFFLACRNYIADASAQVGVEGVAVSAVGNFISYFLLTSGLVWLSDLTMRLVDLPSQKLTGWLVSLLC